MEWKNFFLELLQTVGTKLLFGLIIIFVGFWVCKFIPKLIEKAKGFSKLDETLKSFLLSAIRVTLYAAVVVSAAIVWGVPTTSFITILASAGVAIGLALQGSLSNFAGGIMILLFRPFRDGDYIESGNVAGTVKDVNIFYTRLITPDNKRINVPNGQLSNAPITNYSVMKTRRTDMVINVAYGTDIDSVRAVLLKVAYDCEFLLKEPAPVVIMTAHNESSVEFTLRYYTESSKYWDANFAVREEALKMLEKYGIRIPFPQLDVHIDK